MAHKIDMSNGKENFVSYQQTAWHGLGTVLDEALTIKDALHYGGLDFQVKKLPNTHIIGQVQTVSKTSFFTYREDTLDILGDKVGKDYTVLQNIEALGVLDLILQNNSGIILETAGSLNGGATVFVTAKMPQKIIVGKNDEVEQYLVATNSHDGSSAVRVMFTPVRVVCQNTLTMAIRGAKKMHSIRHTSNVKENFQQSLKLMGFAMNNYEVATESFNQMAKQQLRKDQFWNYIGNVFFSDAEIKSIKSGTPKDEVLSPQKVRLVESVLEYSHSGLGQQEAPEMSSWWAYNGVTGYLSNQKNYRDAEKRFEYLVTDTKIIDKAFDFAMYPQNIQSLSMPASSIVSGLSLN